MCMCVHVLIHALVRVRGVHLHACKRIAHHRGRCLIAECAGKTTLPEGEKQAAEAAAGQEQHPVGKGPPLPPPPTPARLHPSDTAYGIPKHALVRVATRPPRTPPQRRHPHEHPPGDCLAPVPHLLRIKGGLLVSARPRLPHPLSGTPQQRKGVRACVQFGAIA